MSESIEELFERALGLDEAGRRHLLEILADDDPARAGRLARLLHAADADRSPLDADPWAAVELDPEEAQPLPATIGPYRILGELGRGGMGRVYLGLQEGDGFERRLAVKVVAPEGDRPEIERRFRQERSILAGLDHPGIARFLDAGRDVAGRWFLALEYVEGTDLVDYVRCRALPTADRLRLFLAVLDAVAYAHSRGIVHRDLKPANILVDTAGRPRLLDFGIAKLLDAGPTVTGTQTRTAFRALTPAYASPEQVRGEPVSPASDVFSLGVVLYELVAGIRPFRGDGPSRGSLERQILETDPEPPSTASRRAATEGPATPAPAPGRLSRDLDAICLKALRKNPGERYGSVADLAADLDRHLAGRPVAARGDDRRYRVGRWLARNRARLAAGAALTAVGYIVALGLAPRLEVRGDESTAVEPAPRPFPYSGVAASDVAELERAFVATPGDLEAGARLALALDRAGRPSDAALIVARLRQIPGRAEDPLVDYVEAVVAASEPAPQRALVLYGRALERALLAGRGELVAQSRAARGRLLYSLGRTGEARNDLEAARRSFERAGDPASLYRVLADLAMEAGDAGRLDEAERLLEQAVASAGEAGIAAPGTVLLNLANVSLARGFPDRAEPRVRQAIAALEASGSRMLRPAHANLGLVLQELGRTSEAAAEFEAATAPAGVGQEAVNPLVELLRGRFALEQGALERVEQIADGLEQLALRAGDRMPLAFAAWLRGGVAAARDDAAGAHSAWMEARQRLAENAAQDWIEELDVERASFALARGDHRAASEIAGTVGATSSAPLEKTTYFLAAALLARLDAFDGRLGDAAARVAALEQAAAGTTSIRRTRALAAAREALTSAPSRDFEPAGTADR